MTSWQFDSAASSVTVRTRAKGMLARLAHDLEISAQAGAVELSGDASGWHASLHFPVAQLRVVGALKAGRVDASVLSPSDVGDIEGKIQREVLLGREVLVQASGSSLSAAQLDVIAPRGRQPVSVRLEHEVRAGATIVYGKLSLSLRALGIAEIKGPLGAFKVDDAIDVAFWMQFTG